MSSTSKPRYRSQPSQEDYQSLVDEVARLHAPKKVDTERLEAIIGLGCAAFGAGAAFSWPFGLIVFGGGIFAAALLRISRSAL